MAVNFKSCVFGNVGKVCDPQQKAFRKAKITKPFEKEFAQAGRKDTYTTVESSENRPSFDNLLKGIKA